jgi:hypothetical protein
VKALEHCHCEGIVSELPDVNVALTTSTGCSACDKEMPWIPKNEDIDRVFDKDGL